MTCEGQGFTTERHCSCYYDGGAESWEDPKDMDPAWFRCCACGERPEREEAVVSEG